MPTAKASVKKPPTRINDTRLEMVMVKRSVEAANAIIAGNNINLNASAIMDRFVEQARLGAVRRHETA